MPNIGRVAATPIFGPKIPNLANKVKTMQMGALLVATGLLFIRISFFLVECIRLKIRCFAAIDVTMLETSEDA